MYFASFYSAQNMFIPISVPNLSTFHLSPSNLLGLRKEKEGQGPPRPAAPQAPVATCGRGAAGTQQV